MASAGLPTPASLQTMREGKPARGVTAAEFRDIMEKIMGVMKDMLDTPQGREAWKKATGGTPESHPPIYSFDNPSIHTDPDVLVSLGLATKDATGVAQPTDKWLQLPPHSPDLHRTIERAHARLCDPFQVFLYKDTCEYTMAGYCWLLSQLFYAQRGDFVARTIQACMHDIDALYQRVVELHGNIPERKYR